MFGINLTDDIVITPPADFEISLTSGSGWVSNPNTISLTPSGGAVANTTIYVRFNRSSTGASTGNITHTSSGATQKEVAVSGTASNPTITTSGMLTMFSSTAGVASSEQSFTVSGSYLSGNVVVTAPSDFQVSTTSGSGFGASVTLTPTGSTLASTTIYVRMNRATAGSSSGSITVESSGATTQYVPASGTAFTWRAYNDCFVTGTPTNPANTNAIVCSTNAASGVLKDFDTGSSTGATVTVATSGTISTYAFGTPDTRTDAYNTFNGFANIYGNIKLGTSATYIALTFTGLNPAKTYSFVTTAIRGDASYTYRTIFNLSDVANTTVNNASTNGVTLGTTTIESDTSTFNTGYNTTLGYVARWTGIQPGSDGDFVVKYSTTDSQAYGPSVFMLAEELNTNPTITTVGTLTAFNSAVGTTSAEQSYTVSGTNLTNDIVITPPADFEISLTSGSGWVSNPNTISLTPSGGTVSDTTIYVRLNPTSAKTYSENITHTSTDAATKNVAVSGSSVPTITTTSSMTTLNAYTGQYSSNQTYTVSALNLTADLIITPPANFEISLASGSGFVANPGTLTISPVSGAISATTVYVRFKSDTAQTVNGTITHDSIGASQKTVAVSGIATTPPGTVVKSVDKTNASPGDTLNYTIDGIGYTEGNLLNNVTVTDSIPSGTTYVADSDTPEATVTPADDGTATLLTWNLGSNTAGTPGSAGGAGTVALEGTVSTGGTTAAALSLTFSHTTGSGANRLLLVGVVWRNTSTAIPISGVTFNGTTMTQVGTNTALTNRRLAIYSLVNPPASTTGNVVVTLSGSTNATDIVAGAANFSGVDQTTPLGTFATASSSSGTTPSVAVTTVANDLVFDTVVAANGTLTVGSGQTSRWNVTPTTANITSGGSTEPATTTSTTMSWTAASGAWAIGAVPIKPVAQPTRSTTLSAYPTLVSTGVPFTLKATLTNTVADTNVTPGSPTSTVTGGASVSCGSPSPASGSISAGGSLEFTWTCTPTASSTAFGSVALNVSANGDSYSYPSALSNTVLVVPALTFQVMVNNPPGASQIDNYATLDDGGSYLMALNSNTAVTTITTGPTITTSGTLTAFNSQPGVPSAAQTYTVSGSNLTADILVTAPTDFEISTDNITYGSSLPLPQSGGSVGSTTIYVRMNRATEGTPSGNITHTSTDATTRNVAVSGTVLYVYTLTVDNDGHGTVTLSPAGGSYSNGTTVTLTPAPASGYKFSDWSGEERPADRQHRRRLHNRGERRQVRQSQLRRDPAVHADHFGDALGRRVGDPQSQRRHVR